MFLSRALLVATALFAGVTAAAARSFTAQDLATLDRVSEPRLSPDGKFVAYQLREADFAANTASNGVWTLSLDNANASPTRLTPAGFSATQPRWSRDGKSVLMVSKHQVWRVAATGGAPSQVTKLPLDVENFMLSPDGTKLLVSVAVFPDCGADFACTKKRLDEAAARQGAGKMFDHLFIRHWDEWADGRRKQIFLLSLDAGGVAAGAPLWLSRGLDGDVPSKPFGDDRDISFAPDGKSVFFAVRAVGREEAWSTNFDIYRAAADGSAAPENLTKSNPAWDAGPSVSPDGRMLAYRAMKVPNDESDRFGIFVRDLATGAVREIAPNWDRSADELLWSDDGRTLFTDSDDLGQHRIFAIDVASGQVKPVTGDGHVGGFDLGHDRMVYALDALSGPAQLVTAKLDGSGTRTLTKFNADKMRGVELGTYEQFSFKGWNDDTVYGFVVKPAGVAPGKKLPVAFLIHGGPEGSFSNNFHYRWNPQTYVGAGYAVVMIDFHGSTGYGQAFTDAIKEHWGDRPLEDLQKGWKAALAKYDFLDGDRACALGGSYGGYMVNWIAGRWNEPWKCLVNHDGILDTRAMYFSTEELWFTERENGGTPWEKPETYERFNPVNHVDKWRVPEMVVQGGKDFRVPLEQGIGTFNALQRRGIPSQLLYFSEENHWVLKPQNSVQWHQAVESWLKRWTGDAGRS
ncbi:MAG: Dipeptidyl aminopeptidase/acylaminoacyl peptidase [Rhodospirillales bacterium]|nr:Dipeptidyl aminopeptidase/acylaminoacyl peptidase [Rhodospirillales bacterium]